ncbi:hypothetical protein GA0116948_1083 [Chitinophaga costaii]|uniref:Uncharacterized protein n=1 Tax=Chitinophaga costaii TaxID=1335309 RepID=A0A1C4EBW0_9BACT|nr:hypothetical protein [Chitinophaga costaii]PUZ23919.1 hypothetical protein DCM91_14110 [Chitinophaga costaii]SCC41116.1 hypothetical protein GA0116948_1083 [Chitinophaga costaii]
MKKWFALAFVLLSGSPLFAQVYGNFHVGGTTDTFYPVVFNDVLWGTSVATELQLGRADTHTDASSSIWAGTLIARFRFHVTNWGNGSSFCNAEIFQTVGTGVGFTNVFIANWLDISSVDGAKRFMVYLRGGTTYFYTAPAGAAAPVLYDGVANALPLTLSNGTAFNVLTAPSATVNQSGLTSSGTAYYLGGGTNYFTGAIGIGTTAPGPYKLAVEGTIGARKIKVTTVNPWADFVFDDDYPLPDLTELKTYIQVNKHLPGIPTTADVQKEGIDVGDMNAKLLQKVEELTLLLIQQNDRIKALEQPLKKIKLH